ncbi:MAG: carboxypeptidase-like regulatory domain-containing protein, partial [Flavisolibacter sp.]|nr:carboxypeptidase-like regulatory domain-containing protein [Flavisolibacter sp.]
MLRYSGTTDKNPGAKLVLLILFNLIGLCLFAQTYNLSGRITDNNNNPVNKASVRIKGTTKGTTTTANGDFTIAANRNDVLVISSVGFGEQEIAVAGNAPLTITLTPA